MRLSSWLAMGALIGRELAPGERNWKDAVLAAILAKNEIVDKDGLVRKMAAGHSEEDIQELKEALEKELDKRPQPAPATNQRRKGFVSGFMRGFKGK